MYATCICTLHIHLKYTVKIHLKSHYHVLLSILQVLPTMHPGHEEKIIVYVYNASRIKYVTKIPCLSCVTPHFSGNQLTLSICAFAMMMTMNVTGKRITCSIQLVAAEGFFSFGFKNKVYLWGCVTFMFLCLLQPVLHITTRDKERGFINLNKETFSDLRVISIFNTYVGIPVVLECASCREM